MSIERLFNECPICNTTQLLASGIISYEGELLFCPKCDLLLNDCSYNQYVSTNAGWDTEEGTSPKGKAYNRMQKRSRKLLQKIRRHFDRTPDNISILDVGCSAGDFLVVAKSFGFYVEGVEPSKKASKLSMDRGIKTCTGLLKHCNYNDETFDVITMFNVIEHIHEPKQVLREVYRILKPSGLLIIETPTFNEQVQQRRPLLEICNPGISWACC